MVVIREVEQEVTVKRLERVAREGFKGQVVFPQTSKELNGTE